MLTFLGDEIDFLGEETDFLGDDLDFFETFFGTSSSSSSSSPSSSTKSSGSSSSSMSTCRLGFDLDTADLATLRGMSSSGVLSLSLERILAFLLMVS